MDTSDTNLNLNILYSELQKLEIIHEYGKALAVSDRILENFPEEKEAFHCKIICLIQLSKFREALTVIENNRNQLEHLRFERAYCLYRLNDPKKALEVIISSKNYSIKLQELQAQVLYRLEKYEECFKTYREIIKQSHDDYEDERMANLSAVVASIVASQRHLKKDAPQIGEHTYELLYNSACRLAEEDHYLEAEAKLKAAEKLCRNSLEDDGLSEEDILDELAVIRTQTAYCMQKLKREKEAQNIYNSVLKHKPKDIAVIAVASNNSVVINRDQNIFDSKKKIRSCTADNLEFKLASRQRATILFNQCLFALYNHQIEYCSQLCNKLEANFPSLHEGAVLIRSIVLARENKIAAAVDVLRKITSQNVSNRFKFALTAVQLLLCEGDKMNACQLLEDLITDNYTPGILSALITLLGAVGQQKKAVKLLNEAVAWHSTHKSDEISLKSFWKQAADFYLRENDPQAAVKCLHNLLNSSPDDQRTVAKLVIAYLKFDKQKAAKFCDKLPPIQVDNVDISALENISWHSSKQKKTKIQPSPGPSSGIDSNLKAPRKKKKKKLKLPKHYDPNIPPDPERWLPKHERSNFKRKKDRRHRDAGISKGTQGATGASSDQFDITKRSGNSGPQANTHAPRLQQRSKIQHKKKKKGGR